MGLHLIAVAWADFAWIFSVLKVIIGLGLVIFVHELGHFLVAKACGVRCDKFYLGFDFGGLRFCRFRWGETEYGIGVFPLGGYVKMLGQEDNPAKLREEVERAKAAQQSGLTGDKKAEKPGDGCACDAAAIAAAEQALYDPRSYLAKSVPQRMAIISAGVIMNVLFAIVTGAIAYSLGVFQNAPGVGAVVPGSAAWETGLQVDDKLLSIDGHPIRRFNDLRHRISYDKIRTFPVEIQRPGHDRPITVELTPNNTFVPTIGIISPHTTTLKGMDPGPCGSCGRIDLQNDDKIIAVNDRPITRYGEIHEQLGLHPDKTLKLTISRPKKAPVAPGKEDAEDSETQPVEFERKVVDVPPMPMREFGLVMTLGKIEVIRHDSPAAGAGLKPGDAIRKLNGLPPGDALRFPEAVRKLAVAEGKVTLTIQSDGKERDVVIPVRPFAGFEYPQGVGLAVSSPELGIACAVPDTIEQVIPGGPADRADLKSGDTFAAAQLIPPPEEQLRAEGWDDLKIRRLTKGLQENVEFKGQRANWANVFYALQSLPSGCKIKVTLTDTRKDIVLTPVEAKDWFFPSRCLKFQPAGAMVKAESLGAALQLGAEETGESITAVFKFLRRIHELIRKIGGPLMIINQAYERAEQGLSAFCIFLTLIGANLAVLNALPIPVLDGGHMIFLLYEGIAKRPPNERVQLILSYIGLLLLLGLMVFAVGLDSGLISRH